MSDAAAAPPPVTGDSLAGVPRERDVLGTTAQVTGGTRFEEALVLANRLHARQVRKSTSIPYVGHLLGVASLVIEDGGSDDEVIAALLHDAVEDQGGAETLALIRRGFGDAVADIVDACSDTDVQPKPPWHQRKLQYIEHLREAPQEVLRVSAADKLHNARAILADHRRVGDDVFRRFSAPRDSTLAYYCLLDDVYQERLDSGLAAEVHATVEALLAATGSERFTELPAHFPEELEQWQRGRSAHPAP